MARTSMAASSQKSTKTLNFNQCTHENENLRQAPNHCGQEENSDCQATQNKSQTPFEMKTSYIMGIAGIALGGLAIYGFNDLQKELNRVPDIEARVQVLEASDLAKLTVLHQINAKLDMLIPDLSAMKARLNYLERSE